MLDISNWSCGPASIGTHCLGNVLPAVSPVVVSQAGPCGTVAAAPAAAAASARWSDAHSCSSCTDKATQQDTMEDPSTPVY